MSGRIEGSAIGVDLWMSGRGGGGGGGMLDERRKR